MMQSKTNTKIVLIILCYRNTVDVKIMLKSIDGKREDISVIIVNNYYDKESLIKLENIASIYNCDFINVENKGYGYGNNRGIEYAKKKYQYDFIGICNPDIKFEKLSLTHFKKEYFNSIIAPYIHTNSGKKQNPYYYNNIKIIEWLKYIGFKTDVSMIYYLAVIINKINSFIKGYASKFNDKRKIAIYACHGSCYFIGYKALEKIGVPYNEDMFLFHEEEHLAKVASINNINTYYNEDIVVRHFEDGSSTELIENDLTRGYMKDSFLIFYKNWNKK